MSVEIRIGDCRELLRAMPDESVHCVVTSPPYWGLRDYGVDGQIGMEPTLGEHMEVMVDVFQQVRRVLRKDGTCWVNYGDCYATSPNGRSAVDTKAVGNDDRTFRDKPFSTIGPVLASSAADGVRSRNSRESYRPEHSIRTVAGGFLKPKDLCMIANRLAIALQDDGWWVRSEIIWHKPNPMPESVTDRPACQHEKIWMLTKSQKYWYDAEAVRRPMADASVKRLAQDVDSQVGSTRQPGKTNGPMKAVGKRTDKQRGHSRRHAGFNDRWDKMSHDEQTQSAHLKNVWTIATAAFSEAHFATFPPALVEPCIKAGCPDKGIVLDPFGGAGTVGLVADRLQRNAILFELNPEYAAIAERRLLNDGGMFIDVKTSVA